MRTGGQGGALHGIRVLDLTTVLSGPFTTMLLRDLGADVVKLEAPSGDPSRRFGPFRPEDDSSVALGGYFQSVNRGKRSVILDLKAEGSIDRIRRLVRVTDVIVENFSAGVMERLGIPYEVLAQENPALVYAAVRGFGDHRTGRSPYECWPAFDIVAQAMGGLLGITGTEAGTPIKSGPGVADIFPGTLLALAIVSAVRHSERTGQGQFVDVSMYDAVLSLCERIVYQYSYTGSIPRPEGNRHPFLSPFDVVPTCDGWVAVAAPLDHQWRSLALIIGRPELSEDARYATSAGRSERKEEVRRVLEPWFRSHSTSEVVDLLGGRVPVGPVNDIADIFADDHVHQRRMLVDVDQPGSHRPVTVAGSAIKMTLTDTRVQRRAPLLGEDDLDDVEEGWARHSSATGG